MVTPPAGGRTGLQVKNTGRAAGKAAGHAGRRFIGAAALLPLGGGEARAERLVQSVKPSARQLSGHHRKTEDVRTDTNFVDVVVGDPEIADVNPLTDRSLSILGRKSGTTRVSIYGEAKKLIGVFDVEVAIDTAVLSATLAQRFPYAKIKVTAVNSRVMLTGTSPDAATLDGAVHGEGIRLRIINSVLVLAPQQVMLEVRFIEANRRPGASSAFSGTPIREMAAS